MSQFLHPVGPEPPVVYWVRRGAILLVIVTLAIGLWWLIGSLTSSGEPTAEPAPSASASVAASASASPEVSSPSGQPVECQDTDIEVSASTDASAYKIGTAPRLTLTITNSGDVDCLRDVGPKANSLEITSGGYHVWSSDDCNASDKSKVIVLKAGEEVASAISWNGRVTQQGCPNEGTPAKAGRYDLTGRNGDVESEKTPFSLTRKN